MKKYRNRKGFTLVEILIVISIFAVIGLLATRSIFLTLRGAKKSDSLVRVRENINYSLSVIERQLRNAESVTCPNASSSVLDYISLEGTAAAFSCITSGTDQYIASGSATVVGGPIVYGRLTSPEISVSACSFTCTQAVNNPAVVKISVEAVDTESTSVEKGSVSAQTEIVIRNY